MAARKNLTHDERTRKKIQKSQLVNRLIGHALGEIEMTSTQIRAAEILLNKTMPNLQATELTKKTKAKKVSATPLTEDEWTERHNLGTPGGASARTH